MVSNQTAPNQKWLEALRSDPPIGTRGKTFIEKTQKQRKKLFDWL